MNCVLFTFYKTAVHCDALYIEMQKMTLIIISDSIAKTAVYQIDFI